MIRKKMIHKNVLQSVCVFFLIPEILIYCCQASKTEFVMIAVCAGASWGGYVCGPSNILVRTDNSQSSTNTVTVHSTQAMFQTLTK